MRVAIFGSNGMLGKYMLAYLSNFHDCTGITRDIIDASDVNESRLANIVRGHDIIINCIGIIKPRIPETGRLNTIRVNSEFPEILESHCSKFERWFIHICSDCVYRGTTGQYTELDIPDAGDLYARTKSIIPQSASVIRTSFIGEDTNKNGRGLLQWILSNKNKKITGYTNTLWNGTTCLTLCETINHMLRENLFWTGVRHVFSDTVVSKFDICNMVNDIYNLNMDVIPTLATEIEGSVIDGQIDRSLSTVFSDLPQPTTCLYDQIRKQKIFSSENIRYNTNTSKNTVQHI